MKIGFDAKRITHNRTGLGNYSRFVVNGLADAFPQNNYILYSPSPGVDSLRNGIIARDNVSFHYPLNSIEKHLSFLWRSWRVTTDIEKDNIDLFHGLSNELPLNINQSKVASVVTIHDLIFIRYPQLYNAVDRNIYTYKFRQACLQADRIVAVSGQTQRDIVSFFHIPEKKIEVIYQGCDPIFREKQSKDTLEGIKNKYKLPDSYVLYVGSIEERKNLLLAVKAISMIRDDIHLIAVGRFTQYVNEIEDFVIEHNISQRVKLLHNVPFQDLPSLYQMARLFIYPSRFEGFGIPIIEAQSAGIPVIGATGSCLEEAGGEAALYTNPDNPQELKSLIEEVLRNPSLATSMISKGYDNLQRFDSSVLAIQMMNLYNKTYRNEY